MLLQASQTLIFGLTALTLTDGPSGLPAEGIQDELKHVVPHK